MTTMQSGLNHHAAVLDMYVENPGNSERLLDRKN